MRAALAARVLSSSPCLDEYHTVKWKLSSSYLLAQIVEHHDVSVHVEEVVAVRRVLLGGPLLRFGALVREHVIAVLRLVVHAVEAGHLEEKASMRVKRIKRVCACAR